MYQFCVLVILLVTWPCQTFSSERNVSFLAKAINALSRSLQFMEDNVRNINLDGAFGCKLLSEHIDAFIQHRPEVLNVLGDDFRFQLETWSRKAKNIISNAKPYLQQDEPQYYEGLGRTLNEGKELIWYPSRTIYPKFRVKSPTNAAYPNFNEILSDICLKGLLGTRNTEHCSASPECLEYMTKPDQGEYTITHQVLYFQIMEKEGCLGKSPEMKIPKDLQMRLCSDILVEAEEIARLNYPPYKRDLFMEQIGLCGIWGFKDFYQTEWLENILKWQEPSGCYGHEKRRNFIETFKPRGKLRVKRAEKEMDDGCLSHKTSVALIALFSNIRFNAEKMSHIE